ncbi:MAG: MFS transporter [Alphaproteobacteria bacterium]|nr:MFS transporter [Alphaproteobacteria bacterium]MBU0794968.1 MFS transporter [Alphaproteobacteria bacterium]MBU0876626.1 MFS transporter [Alphaproteobacteria bacterium]MBU1769328.1 MFS transporter [Alphaproteobacteria bacterium]
MAAGAAAGPAEGNPARRRAGIAQGVTVMFAAFLPILAIVGLAPAVPSIIEAFADVPGATTLVPLAVTAPGLMIALFSPLMGWFADRHGRRKLLLGATVIYGFVGTIPFFVDSIEALIASRLALGICEAAILTVTNTLIGDYFSHDERRGWLTFQGVIGPIFGTGTVFLSGFLAAQSWQLPFVIYAVAFPISLLMLLFLFEPDVKAEVVSQEAPQSTFPWRQVTICCSFTLFAAALYYVYIVQVGRAFGEVGVASAGDIGTYISIASIGVVLGALLFQWVSRRFSSDLQLLIFLSLLGVGLVGIGLSNDPTMMTGFAFVQQLGAGILIPALVLWTVSHLPPEHRGRGMGIWSGCFFLGQFVSPLLVTGTQMLSGSIRDAFIILGIISIAGGLSARLMTRWIK